MNDSTKQPVTNPARNPYTPWFVMAAFILPVALAYGLYFLEIAPPSFNNRGELLNPIQDIVALELKNENGKRLSRDEITQGQWHLIYFAGAMCDTTCNSVLQKLRQIHGATAKNSDRLSRLIVHLEPADTKFNELISKSYSKTRHASTDRQTVLSAMQLVKPDLDANEVYLMDPIGNVLMRYTEKHSRKDILSDLKKLFKVSQIG